MSVLSLGLLLPLGVITVPGRISSVITDATGATPTKHVFLTNGTQHDAIDTRSLTTADLLRERGIAVKPADHLSTTLDSPLIDGETIEYRPAVPIDVVIDGVHHAISTVATNVGQAIAAAGVRLGSHDAVVPSPASPVEPNTVIAIHRTTSWLERVRSAVLPPVRHRYDIALSPGTQRVVDPGRPGTKETTIEVLQPNPDVAPKRTFLAARILRFPRAKVVAEGVGDYSTLAGIARRGIASTVRLADQALRMVATAYTSACSGCSGMTASGRQAGRGVVAVDPQIIPLGSHLFIPGYGHAYAGDTGGSIHGNRIDLGFTSARDAQSFGRRRIVVYVLK